MTVFVTNDGVKYSAGFGDGDGAGVDDGGDADPSNDVGAYPARVVQGATFTYFDANAFVDAPKFVPASTSSDVDLALRGGPKAAARFFSSSDVASLSAAASPAERRAESGSSATSRASRCCLGSTP